MPGHFKPGDLPPKWDEDPRDVFEFLFDKNGKPKFDISVKTFKEECIDVGDLRIISKKLFQLSEPDDYAAAYAKESLKMVTARQKNCQRAASEVCQNTHKVKDALALSYVTTQCKIRNVTKKDINEDITIMASQRVTEADRMMLSLMIDRIDACESASALGFESFYGEPSLSGCKPTEQ